MIPLRFLNTRGLPAIESINITVDGSNTNIIFNRHNNPSFSGGFWVKIGQTLATGANTIQFSTSDVPNSTVPLYLQDGTQATAANLVSDGNSIHLCFYDGDSGRLTLVA